MRLGRWRGLAYVCTALVFNTPEPAAADTARSAPVAALRSVDGIAYVAAHGSKRLAEPLSGLKEHEIVEVESGTVVVFDLACRSEQTLGAGSRYVVPRSSCDSDAGLLQRVGAALDRVRRAPQQTIQGATRGNGATWPDDVRFAPDAAITFRWGDATRVASFHLTGPEGATTPTRYERPQPPKPLPWPAEVTRRPGKYRWEIRDADERTIGSATVVILTTAETSAKLRQYRDHAKQRFGDARLVDLGAEVLAAGDGYFLK
jgi:hypothetical protein